MADVTISSLPLGTPSGNGLIPFSQGGTTYQSPISAIFQNRPAFNATTTLSQVRGPGIAPFNYARINVGGFFDTSNYRYNVPVTGLYQINIFCNYIGTSTGQPASIHIRKNGNTQIGTWIYQTTDSSSNWMNLAGSEILSLSQGEYIQVYNANNGYIDRSDPASNSWWSTFSGYLIG